jgi:hypothetical protein
MGYAEAYSKLSNDEILSLAADPNGLREDARSALIAEMAVRKLSTTDVEEYQRHLSTIKPGQMPGQEQFIARSFNGFGTAIYGKRDFLADGSYVTTKWVVFFWIPILPLSSMRVRQVGGGVLPGWTANYIVLSKGRPLLQQVLYVYAFMFAIAGAWWNLEPKPNIVNTSVVCILLILPFLVRKIAKVRATRD